MARDLIHQLVRLALEKDGWLVTQDPYAIKVGGFDMEIDLAAENLLVAEKGLKRLQLRSKALPDCLKFMIFTWQLASSLITELP